MKATYICPECGHKFEQGEWNYNYDFANLEFECPDCGWTGTDSTVKTDDDAMKSDILWNIIQNAGDVDNLVSLQQEYESNEEYDDRLYEEAHDLFMDSVAELGCDELDDEDVAPYDDIREDTIADIVDLMKHGEQSLTFYLLNEKNN